ncbi:flagellin [Rhodoblastus acidophilus]|uniref:flagellin N-terminal helical domain-containing protein n=1 Tax=Rhodoblastus acidophilus TaxID=1074 RepID=UPI0022250CF2|nr:flagellin [Rhodoblastus acidophilus]MCW2284612.1 flagellin [Rhodoblastus acidophilus]MCW2333565.1 flagellin [Rhodoblastus acidophilus]
MSYLLTNASAMTALQNLASTQKNLSTTQSQLSTGLAIQNASDNSSYWSIAKTMDSDNGALEAVGASLKVAGQMVSTFTTAMTQAMSVVNKIKNDLAEAQTSGADLTQIGTDVANQVASLKTIFGGATFNGQNWLDGTTTTANIANAYTNSNGVTGIAIDATTMGTLQMTDSAAGTAGVLNTTQSGGASVTAGLLSITVSTSDTQDTYSGSTRTKGTLSEKLDEVNAVISKMESASATLGSYTQTIEMQQQFISTMQTNLSNGVASLVQADMNQVSTRLQALQTQQQLGVQSLSIANQSSQMILKLFQ